MEDVRDVELDRKGKRFMHDDADGSYPIGDYGPLQFIPYCKLKEATNDFAESNVLSSCHLSIVYKGKLPPTHEMVAVKQFRIPSSSLYPSAFEEELDEAIWNERRALLNVVNQHPNIVKIVGCCIDHQDSNRKYFIYDFIPLKSLDTHIHGFWGKTLS